MRGDEGRGRGEGEGEGERRSAEEVARAWKRYVRNNIMALGNASHPSQSIQGKWSYGLFGFCLAKFGRENYCKSKKDKLINKKKEERKKKNGWDTRVAS